MFQVRVYAMNLFDETREYWGDKMEKVFGEGDGTLTARSVKIFADGKLCFLWRLACTC